MKRVLILGASGLVGRALSKELDKDYDVYGTYYSKITDMPVGRAVKLDINNIRSIDRILKEIRPELIISCLRGDFEKQLQVHIEAARFLKNTNGKLYFCSTANVFDNDPYRPHYEDDRTSAESEYGKFKIRCEEELGKILINNLCILRLPMIWCKKSPRLNNLLEKLDTNQKIEAYTNLYINNNTDKKLAKQIHYIMRNNLKGIFHLGTYDMVRHYDFISQIIKGFGYKNIKIKEALLPYEEYYLAVMTKRVELPNKLRFSNEELIKDLII